VVKLHPYYTFEILRRIPGFGELSEIAGAHHEKLDGSGYFRHLNADHLSLEMRILTVADIYDALAAKRPYRDAMPPEKVFGIMQKEALQAIDPHCLEALMTYHATLQSSQDLLGLSANVGTSGAHTVSEEKSEKIVPAR
jgi:HD-GYP domain-containing protein (c-di-GMP phosphodiesterase class II)